jgi:hypothetical protein
MFGWTVHSYVDRLRGIRNIVASGFGYASWSELWKDRGLVADFVTFHKLEAEWKYGASVLAPMYMKDDWEQLAGNLKNLFASEVARHRKTQVLAVAVEKLAPSASDDQLDEYIKQEKAHSPGA